MFKKGFRYFTFIQCLILSMSVSAASALPLEDQGGGVIKFLSNQNKYHIVYGFASIDGTSEHLGYLALEHQGNWNQFDMPQNAANVGGYSITRLGFKGEAFGYKYLHQSNLHSGAKFDFYLADTHISPDYHWQALGIGAGYIFTPLNQFSGLQITTGLNVEPGFFRINGKSFDQYQLQPYSEMELFVSPNFAIMAKFDAIYTGDLDIVERRVTDYWMGLRLFF